MENEHDNVLIGRMIDVNSYVQEKKNVLIEGTINIDFIRKSKQIHEVKKSKSIEEASVWQVKYYLYYLKKLGMEDVKGVIDYPLLRKNLIVELEKEDEEKIEEIIKDIKNIINRPLPPSVNRMKICKNCAYYELCFI